MNIKKAIEILENFKDELQQDYNSMIRYEEEIEAIETILEKY